MCGNRRDKMRDQIETGASTGITRRRVLAMSGTALAGAAIGSSPVAARQGATKTDFGAAAPNNPILGLNGSGETAYLATYAVKPAIVGGFDINNFEFTDNYVLPRGLGAWALADRGDHLYVGTYDYTTNADLIDIDTATGDVEVVAPLSTETFTWDAGVADDGTVYVGSYPNCRVYEYDPATGDVRWFGPMADGEDYVRSLAVDGETVYAGVGSHAHLAALDRTTGEWTQILPDALSDRSWVYGLGVAEDKIVANIEPGGIALLDKADPENDWQWIDPGPDMNVSGVFEVFDGDVYAPAYSNTEPGWFYYRYDVANETWTDLGSIPGYSFPDRYLHGDTVVGTTSDRVWTKNLQTGEVREDQVVDVGMKPGAEVAQSLATLHETPVVASSGRLNIHDNPSTLPTRVSTRGDPQNRDLPLQTPTGGEPKAMVSVGDDLYMASYTSARLYHYDDTGDVKLLVNVSAQQNRPRDLAYQSTTDTLLMGTKPDYGYLGGAITAYDRKSGKATVERNVVQDQSIRSVTSIGATAYLGSEIYGGLGSDPTASEAKLAAWDPVAKSKRWQMTPVKGATELMDVEAVNGLIFGVADLADSVQLFVVDPESRSTIHTAPVAGGGELAVGKQQKLYGALGDGITEIDTETFETTRYLDGFNHLGEITTDHQGHLYVVGFDQYHLYQIEIGD